MGSAGSRSGAASDGTRSESEEQPTVAAQFKQALIDIEHNAEMLQRMRDLSLEPSLFRHTPSKDIAEALDSLFETAPGEDEPPYVQLANRVLALDPNLGTVRRKLVPSRVKELQFWRNYLTHFVLLDSEKLQLPVKMTRYTEERKVAIEAVRKACKVTQLVFRAQVSEDTITKNDKSPVTIADFSAQAVINHEIKKAFPEDLIVGEEHSSDLKGQPEKQAKVTRVVNSIYPPPGFTETEILQTIDLGNHTGGPNGRFWVVDPVDGTAGFLRGEQYAVCLALIENGQVVVGVLGCPNLPKGKGKEGNGIIFYAEVGRGAYSASLEDEAPPSPAPASAPTPAPTTPASDSTSAPSPAPASPSPAPSPSTSRAHVDTAIRVSGVSDVTQAVFCESVEAGHSSHSDAADIAALLGISTQPVRMDSQCKYAAVARGDATIYMRLPTRPGYEEKIWDHAAGWLIVREAGGEVTDVTGKALDFSLGRTLKENKGVVATNKRIHAKVLAAVHEVLNPPLKHFGLTIKRERRSVKEVREAIAAGLGVDPRFVVVEESS